MTQLRPPSGTSPWERYWATVGNEDWLAARRLCELSTRVCRFFAAHLAERPAPEVDDDGTESAVPQAELILDWEAAAAGIDADGFSATEHRLAQLVAALTTGQPVDLGSLRSMGSWSTQVWQNLLGWGTDGQVTARAWR